MCCRPRPSRRDTCCRSSDRPAPSARRVLSSAAICCSMVFGMSFWASNSLIAAILPFGARAVVAPDVEDDGVVADAELVEIVDQLADLGVRVLDEAGDRPPSAAAGTGAPPRGCCPTPPWTRRGASASCPPGSSRSASAGENLLAISSQPSSNLPLYLSAHSVKTWCGPCAAPGAQYMKNGLSGENAWCRLSQASPCPPCLRSDGISRSCGGSIALSVLDRAAVPTARFRRRGSHRSSRSHGRSASGRTGPSPWSGWPACCATCRTPPTCSRSGAAPRRWWPRSWG